MIEEIRNRLEVGYTLSVYGTSELLYEQMKEDISSLLILFDAQKQNKLDLVKLDKQVNEILAKETKESLTAWLENKRKNEDNERLNKK